MDTFHICPSVQWLATFAGAVTQDGSTFTVSGSHTYTMPGDYTATVTITPPDGGVPNTVQVDVNVSSIVPGAAQSFSPVQGDLQTFTVATFTDTVSSTPLSNYTPVVDWGDGNVTGGTITSSTSGSVTTFTVTASNAYASAGSFSPTVTITSTDGSTTTLTDSATVSGITGTGEDLTPTQGVSYAGPIVDFTDNRTGISNITYSGVINWGDGTTSSPITAVSDSNGGYLINGTHTYTTAGSFDPSVTITSSDGLTATISASAEVTGIVINPGTVNAISGTSFSGPVFDFTDDGPTTGTDTYTPTIAWGDGTTSAGVYVSDGNNDNGYVVSGTHTYSEPGNYNATVTVTGANSGFTATDTVTINVAGITATAASTITGEEGQTFAGPVATFTSSVSGTSASGYSAGINWGDGNNSPGIITKNGSTFTVSGTNVFAQAGTIAPTVTITDPSGELTTVTDSATVDGIVVTTQAVPGTAGVNSNYVLGTFSDTASGTSGLTYTAFADWQGNGNPIALTVTSQGEGVYQVSGDYNFPVGQTTDPIISVYASNGVFSTANGEVDVQASYGTTPQLLNPVAGSTFAGIVGDFTYSVPNTDPSQFQGTITWGDGNTSDGIITSDGQGGFDVIGTNTFASAGNYLPSISVSDQYGNSTTITDTALVGASSPITTQPGSATATEGTPYTFYFAPVQPSGGTISSWSLNWGDGSALVEGSGGPPPASLQHTFASGYSSSNITYGFSGSMGNSNGSWTAGVVPASPTNVNASWNSNGTASLTWDESSSLANGFTISQSVNGTAFVPVATITSATTTSDTLSGLDPTADYAFQVNANGSGGTTSPFDGSGSNTADSGSDSDSLAPFNGGTPIGPETPSIESVDSSSSDIEISFTYPTDGSSLELEDMGPGDLNYQWVADLSGTPGQTGTYDIDASPDSTYYIRLRAALLGALAYGSETEVNTPSDDTQAPQIISITNDTSGLAPGTIDIVWHGPEDVVLQSQFSVGQNIFAPWPEEQELYNITELSNDDYSATVTLLPGTNYQCQLYSGTHYSGWTDVNTTIATQPTPVLSESSPDSEGNVTLSWTYTGNPFDLFDVEEFEYLPGSSVLDFVTTDVEATSGSVQVPANWACFVVAENNQTAPSNLVMPDPTDAATTPPAAPQNLTATLLGSSPEDQNKVSLIWDNDPDDESGYIVEDRFIYGSDTSWQQIGETGADQTNFVYALPGGSPIDWAEPREYQVIAFNGGGGTGGGNEDDADANDGGGGGGSGNVTSQPSNPVMAPSVQLDPNFVAAIDDLGSNNVSTARAAFIGIRMGISSLAGYNEAADTAGILDEQLQLDATQEILLDEVFASSNRAMIWIETPNNIGMVPLSNTVAAIAWAEMTEVPGSKVTAELSYASQFPPIADVIGQHNPINLAQADMAGVWSPIQISSGLQLGVAIITFKLYENVLSPPSAPLATTHSSASDTISVTVAKPPPLIVA